MDYKRLIDALSVEAVRTDSMIVRDAAIALKELLAERDKIQAGWISVKDRMPEHDTAVLALTANGCLSIGRNQIVAMWLKPPKEKNGMWVDAHSFDHDPLEVTHWRPLPELNIILCKVCGWKDSCERNGAVGCSQGWEVSHE